jgi:carbon-monoxide dehydrogenase medium subunit
MGGTDLFPALRDGRERPDLVIDVKHLSRMRTIQFDAVDGLSVGAAVTMNELSRHSAVCAHYALLAEAAATVASYQIRNRATLGGNLCNASPCADTSPSVLVLEGSVVLYGPAGARQVPAAEFFRGPGQTVMGPAEFMTAVRFPPAPDGLEGTYLKLGRCRSGDLALVGVAAAAYPSVRTTGALGASNGPGHRFRIALGSVAPVPLRATAAEDYLNSHKAPDAGFERAADLASHATSPITDVRGGASYQAAMVRTLTLRALRKVWALVGEGG